MKVHFVSIFSFSMFLGLQAMDVNIMQARLEHAVAQSNIGAIKSCIAELQTAQTRQQIDPAISAHLYTQSLKKARAVKEFRDLEHRHKFLSFWNFCKGTSLILLGGGKMVIDTMFNHCSDQDDCGNQDCWELTSNIIVDLGIIGIGSCYVWRVGRQPIMQKRADDVYNAILEQVRSVPEPVVRQIGNTAEILEEIPLHDGPYQQGYSPEWRSPDYTY